MCATVTRIRRSMNYGRHKMRDTAITHPDYGHGLVLETRDNHRRLLVQFDSGQKRLVWRAEVDDTVVAPPVVAPRRREEPPDKVFHARRMIEAFRLGIVPGDSASTFTFGRDHEVAAMTQWLQSTHEHAKLLIGEYGTGKTHLLQYLHDQALRDGFAVAMVEMDPRESPFHWPKRVYSRLAASLQFRLEDDQPPLGFCDLLGQAFARRALVNHVYFSHVQGELFNPVCLDWIMGAVAGSRPYDRTSPRKYAALRRSTTTPIAPTSTLTCSAVSVPRRSRLVSKDCS